MLNIIKTWIKDRIAFRKASKLAKSLMDCEIYDYVVDYVDGKLVLKAR